MTFSSGINKRKKGGSGRSGGYDCEGRKGGRHASQEENSKEICARTKMREKKKITRRCVERVMVLRARVLDWRNT